MNLNSLKPYELGESGSKDAIFFLNNYLKSGTDNEKRLSASAIQKLALNCGFKYECNSSVPLLINNLRNIKPQVRQYSLKALLCLDVSSDYLNVLKDFIKYETKEYNISLLNELIYKISSCKEYSSNNSVENKSIPVREATYVNSNLTSSLASSSSYYKRKSKFDEKGYVYIIQEDLTNTYKIGKAKNLGERLNLFSVQLPFNIKLIHVIWDKNYGMIEQLLHIHFQNKRLNGEWFSLSKEDINWIRDEKYKELTFDFN